VKSCGYRVVRLLLLCAIAALASLMIIPSQWPTSSTQHNSAVAWEGLPSKLVESEDKVLFPLIPSGDSGRLELPITEILLPDLVPPDVHFIWCGERWFEFKNYLSVMSVRRAIQPDKIYIHYQHQPPLDRVNYHQV